MIYSTIAPNPALEAQPPRVQLRSHLINTRSGAMGENIGKF